MAFGRNRGNAGLDLSGVGKSRLGLSGGSPNRKSRYAQDGFDSRSSRPTRSVGRSSRGEDRSNSVARKQRNKLYLRVGLLVAAALLVAIAVGVLVYQQTVKAALKPNLDSSTLSSVLTPVESATDPFWVVLAATDASSAEEGRGAISNLALVYVDPDNESLSFLWIPTDTRVYLDGYGYHQIGDAFKIGGAVSLTTSVASLGDVSIAHYLEVNEAGLAKLEQDLGYSDGGSSTTDRNTVVSALARKIFGSSTEQLSTDAGYFTTCVATDLDTSHVNAIFTSLQGLDVNSDVYAADMPATSETDGGVTYSIADEETWKQMLTRVSSGMSPVASKKELLDYKSMRANSTVTIWNGVGVSGVADDCSQELKRLGWTIESTGNAAQFVYSETLVVYKDSSDESLAELLVSDLGQGRAVRSAARYSFNGSLLVVIGKDYQPY